MTIQYFKHEYAFLSNFYPSKILPPTLEHHYQAAKCFLVEDKVKILSAPTPRDAKRLGRIVMVNYEWWEREKYNVMMDLVAKKFSDPELAAKLINTEDENLEEGNYWHDNYWGACWCERCRGKVKQNLLGVILMYVRATLIDQINNKG